MQTTPREVWEIEEVKWSEVFVGSLFFTCLAAGWKLVSWSEALRSHSGETISTTRIALSSKLYSPTERGTLDVPFSKKEMSSGMFSTSTTLWKVIREKSKEET